MCDCDRMLPGCLKDAVDVWTWKRCYSMQEVNSALSRVQLVGYSQKVVRGFSDKGCCTQPTQSDLRQRLFFFSFPGVVWSGAGLTFKLRLLAGQLELDHPVSSREGFIRFRLFSAHHAPTGGSAQRRWSESRRAERQTCRVFQPMDQSSLKNSDVLILTGLTQMPTANPDGMLGEFCSNLGQLRQS